MKKKPSRFLVILFVFITVLTSFRLLWIGLFYNDTIVDIDEGFLDLQTLDLSTDNTFMLDGEWLFYPETFLVDDSDSESQEPAIISVPNGWRNHLDSPYGYGSYRLLMTADPSKPYTYGLYMSSVRSSYDVYVNNERLASSGKTAPTKQNYIAKNLPEFVPVEADDDGLIDLVIQAANYNDIRDGGVIRSVMFGTEEAVRRTVQLSTYAQIILLVIFISHAFFALIFYFLGNRDKRLIYFSLLTFCFTIYSFLSTGDKILHQFFYIGYDWDFRLTNALGLLAWYFLLQTTKHQQLRGWKNIFPYYRFLIWILAVITMLLPVSLITQGLFIYALLILVALLVSLYSIINDYRQAKGTNLLIVFSSVSIIHHFIWLFVWLALGIYVPYYPFDLIIAVSLYLLDWFRKYFQVYNETKAFADRLVEINEEKDQFLINTSHEFRTPLNSMLLFTEAIHHRDKEYLSPQSLKELKLISDVGKQMSVLFDDLLSIKQLEDKPPRLNKLAISLEPIITGVLDLLQFSIEVKQFNVNNQVSEKLPPVYADEYRLTQIFLNLISNAIKFTDDGELTISAGLKGEFLEVRVSDTGIGISPDYHEQIFLPYEQGNQSKQEREGGFGLGLSIVKELVELHQGTITVESTKGEGTTFIVNLPLAADGEKVDNLIQSAQNMSDIKKSVQLEQVENSGRPTILIVDDNPAGLMALKSILPDEKYDTTLASNATQALEQIKEKHWDLVISDIMMPEISGYQLTKRIREQYKLTELPVLLLSGGQTDIQACFASGANDYIQKPLNPVELKARLDSLVSLKRGVEHQLELETSWLQAQIQPHFIFNTLNSIKALSEWDTTEMQKLLDHLSHYLRSKFKFQHSQTLVPVEEELSLVRSYLYIEQTRFQDHLEVVWELDELDDVLIPFISIQPLVENAIHHGIRKKQGKGTIMISIRKNLSGSIATIAVSDDGVGIASTKLDQLLREKPGDESGVGILNVNQRLKQTYGSGLSIVSSVNQGTTISFEIDLNKK